MRVTWFGHSAFRLEIGSSIVLIDPFLTGNPAFTADRAEAVAGVTHILLTHGHDDHVGDTLAIAAETGAKVVSNYDLCMFLAAQGLANIDPMNTGGTVDQGNFAVTLVRADHSAALSAGGILQAVGSANGIIVRAKGERVLYHMGDTDIFSDMELIAEIHQPRVAIVPIGDRFTMGPRVAALAVSRFFDLDVAIPAHYASFPPLEPNADTFVKALEACRTEVKVPEVGIPFDL